MSDPDTSAAQELRALLDQHEIPLPQKEFKTLLDFVINCGDLLENFPEGRTSFLVGAAARLLRPEVKLVLLDDAGVTVTRSEYGDGVSSTWVNVEGIGAAAATHVRLRALARAANAAADIMAAVRGEV